MLRHFIPDNERNGYMSLWNKYRPVVLQLMKSSSDEPRQYKLSGHEFKALSGKAKVTFSFVMETRNGKAINNIASSAPARDLLHVLQLSKTGVSLMRESPYQFSLDKDFVFQVTRMPQQLQAESADAEPPAN